MLPSGSHEPELDAHDDLLARATAHCLPQQQLVVAHTVVVTGVEQGDAGVESGLDRGDALRLVCGTVEVRHAHAAQAQRRDATAGRTQGPSDHRVLLSAGRARTPRAATSSARKRSAASPAQPLSRASVVGSASTPRLLSVIASIS
jgi:hypothetical protein